MIGQLRNMGTQASEQTWPEQEAIVLWIQKHGIDAEPWQVRELSGLVSEHRIKAERELHEKCADTYLIKLSGCIAELEAQLEETKIETQAMIDATIVMDDQSAIISKLENERDSYEDAMSQAQFRFEKAEAELELERRMHERTTEHWLDTKKQLDAIRGLLKVAECPDGNCIHGDAAIFKGEHVDGAEEWEAYECQWCAERKAALQGEKDG